MSGIPPVIIRNPGEFDIVGNTISVVGVRFPHDRGGISYKG